MGAIQNLPTNDQLHPAAAGPAISRRSPARLEDRVADNDHRFDITESGSPLAGTNSVIVADIETGPYGDLFVASLDQGAIHEISRR
jgi:hypothetical protein